MASVPFLTRLLLVGCLFVSTQSLLLVQVAFSVRQDWIAETLCVNRNHPERECDGHCVLMNRLDAHHDHEEDSGAEASAQAPTVLFLIESDRMEPLEETPVRYARAPDRARPRGHAAGVFRPPRAV